MATHPRRQRILLPRSAMGLTCCAVFMVLVSTIPATAQSPAERASLLREIQTQLRTGLTADLTQQMIGLHKQLTEIDSLAGADVTTNAFLAIELTRAIRLADKQGDLSLAHQLAEFAITATRRDDAQTLSQDQHNIITLSAASLVSRTGRPDLSIDWTNSLFEHDHSVTDDQKRFAAKLLITISSNGLAENDPATAARAYESLIQYLEPSLSERQRQKAMFGRAWALMATNEDLSGAAAWFAEFVEAFPESREAALATARCADCLRQVQRDQDARLMELSILDRWPDSPEANQLISRYAFEAVDELPAAVRQWASQEDRIDRLDAPASALAFRIAIASQQPLVADRSRRHLALIDHDGSATSDLLQWLDDNQQAGDAEHLAGHLISPARHVDVGQPIGAESSREHADDVTLKAEALVTPAAREAACRWAGRSERWTLLAMASEAEDPAIEDATRTLGVERLFAEALTQTGQSAAANRWWIHLVDGRGCNDFPTLLRCAETSTAVGAPAQSKARIDAARVAAAGAPSRISLVDMLAAELAIRRLDFQGARRLLEAIVRRGQTPATIQGRAQWLIGESFFLQRRFDDAIDAYRLVQSIDPNSEWVAAALLQAGKSFEQLGRSRDASLCYSNLLALFADSPHAQSARNRLAAISPHQPNPTTIRR